MGGVGSCGQGSGSTGGHAAGEGCHSASTSIADGLRLFEALGLTRLALKARQQPVEHGDVRGGCPRLTEQAQNWVVLGVGSGLSWSTKDLAPAGASSLHGTRSGSCRL